MMEMMMDFAKQAKRDNIKRINMIMHAWTLWSAGKITSEEVTLFLKNYDEA